jgi:hypothetical protein
VSADLCTTCGQTLAPDDKGDRCATCTPAPVSDTRREEPETVEAACAWSDYRRAYGASAAAEHRAFMAGRASVLGRLDGEGVLR